MKKVNPRTMVLLIAGLLSSGLTIAQQSVNATGGDATGSGGNLAYSVGEILYISNTNTSGTVGQGVQQAYEIFTLDVHENALVLSISVFPNPTADNLTLQINDLSNERLLYQLFDMQGKLISNGQIATRQTTINTAHLPSATYIINIVNNDHPQKGGHSKRLQSFKIIKN